LQRSEGAPSEGRALKSLRSTDPVRPDGS